MFLRYCNWKSIFSILHSFNNKFLLFWISRHDDWIISVISVLLKTRYITKAKSVSYYHSNKHAIYTCLKASCIVYSVWKLISQLWSLKCYYGQMGTSSLLLFSLKWPITKVEKTSKSLKTHWMESIYAKIWSERNGKVGFSGTPKNLPKMYIIEEYLLGGPIFEQKVQVLYHFDSETFFLLHPEKI